MIARLSDELVQELERSGDRPLRVENPRNHKRYVIIPEDQLPAANPQGLMTTVPEVEWTEAKNARRFALIAKDIAGIANDDEKRELGQLQQEIDKFLSRVAPLPLAAACDLHERLRQSLTPPAQP